MKVEIYDNPVVCILSQELLIGRCENNFVVAKKTSTRGGLSI